MTYNSVKSSVKNINWIYGTIENDFGRYDFCIKRFENGSEHGINEGRILKLEIRIYNNANFFGKIIANYDSTWEVEVSKEHKKIYQKILNKFN